MWFLLISEMLHGRIFYISQHCEQVKKGREPMNIEKSIAAFLKTQQDSQKRSKRKEKHQVCIKPDSYIGREIQYQTALLHEILAEIRETQSK